MKADLSDHLSELWATDSPLQKLPRNGLGAVSCNRDALSDSGTWVSHCLRLTARECKEKHIGDGEGVATVQETTASSFIIYFSLLSSSNAADRTLAGWMWTGKSPWLLRVSACRQTSDFMA